MKILLDTNVVLDVLLERQPYYHSSAEIFTLSTKSSTQLFITSNIFTDLYYIVSKILSRKKAKEFLSNLLEIVDICGVEKSVILKAMNSDFTDLEDAVQFFGVNIQSQVLSLSYNI